MSVMGLDIGTSGCKALVFDARGLVVSQAQREYPTLMPGEGWAELDSEAVIDACLACVAEAARGCPSRDRVAALGVSSQGEAFTLVDGNGRALSHAMVSFDTRAAGVAARWSSEFGRDRLYRITGHTAHPMFSLFKLLWVRESRPDLWQKASRVLCFEDLLHLRLGLEPAISYPMAGRTMLFDVRAHQWSADILDAVGFSAGRLSRPVPSGTVVGQLSPTVAADLDLLPGASVVAGGHDQPCGALGAGVLHPGRAMYGMGTVECICPAFESPVFSDSLFRGNLCTYDFTAKGMYTTVAFSLTGGNLLRWYRDQLGGEEVRRAETVDRDVYEILLEGLPDAPSGLLVLPHFTPTGTPHFDTRAYGAVLGLTLETTRPQLLAGLLEGVTLEMKLNVEMLDEAGVRIDEFVATGGGARSARLTQLKADVLNRPITAVAVTEAGCLGVAMLAREALGEADLESTAASWVRPVSVTQPRAAHAEAYGDLFGRYRTLYPTLKAFREGIG